MKRILLVGLALASPVVLAGCGAGRHNQQYLERSVVNGAAASSEGLSIRNAYVTRPVPKGGTAVVAFSVYADDPQAATQLVSVTSQKLSGGVPAELSRVSAGVTKVSTAVPIDYQSGPGANVVSATFSDIDIAATSAAYVDLTFTFANNLTLTLPYVPVAQVGQVDPLSTSVPTSFPEQPFPLNSALPGEGAASASPSDADQGSPAAAPAGTDPAEGSP